MSFDILLYMLAAKGPDPSALFTTYSWVVTSPPHSFSHTSHFLIAVQVCPSNLSVEQVKNGERYKRRVYFLNTIHFHDNTIKMHYENLSCDIPMAQFIVTLNAQQPANRKFIIHVLDNTPLFIQPDGVGTIRTKIQEFRDQNTYEKPP
ncbi:General transcription and DNA repair factor IIH subunit TFB5-like protein [Drosera capensis]